MCGRIFQFIKNAFYDTNPKFRQSKTCIRNIAFCSYFKHNFESVVHFAAESHVDRSIDGPADFIQTNIVGTLNLLEQSRKFALKSKNKNFKFLHVSTDEVYGSLGSNGKFFEK